MKKVIKVIKEFNKVRDWEQFHTPENLAKSISIESGELLECFQWNNKYNKQELSQELADVVSYCLMLADAIDADLEQIILDKYEMNAKKYPVEKAKGISTKYNNL